MNIDDLKGQTNGKYAQGGGNGSVVENIFNHITHIEVVDIYIFKNIHTKHMRSNETIGKKNTTYRKVFFFFTFISCL
jgi:hypothetical protein